MAGSGGASSILSMIITLRENRKLLRRRPYFKGPDGRFERDPRDPSASVYGDLDCTPARPEQLKAIRAKMLRFRKRQTWAVGFVVVFGLSLVIGGVAWMHHTWPPAEYDPLALYEARTLDEKRDREATYQFYLADGDAWLQKENWRNASFQYQQAYNMHPERAAPLQRLLHLNEQRCAAGDFTNAYCRNVLKIEAELRAQEIPDSAIVFFQDELSVYFEVGGWEGSTHRVRPRNHKAVVADYSP